MGFGTRDHDYPPYRAVGPVTVDEYESRMDRYDKQLQEQVGIDPKDLTTTEKMAHIRKYREEQYEELVDTVYKRRGWNERGIPTLENLRRLGIDLPEVVAIIEHNQ
jgi:aldehyde:ferredoxin oxidoreductase